MAAFRILHHILAFSLFIVKVLQTPLMALLALRLGGSFILSHLRFTF